MNLMSKEFVKFLRSYGMWMVNTLTYRWSMSPAGL